MKAELEMNDVKVLAREVIKLLQPLIVQANKSEPDTIFDVKELAAYLKVDTSWIYNRVHLVAIPYFKCGKYTRFKKSVIDKWIEQATIKPILSNSNR
jgi:excisionase family DNA binding protein